VSVPFARRDTTGIFLPGGESISVDVFSIPVANYDTTLTPQGQAWTPRGNAAYKATPEGGRWWAAISTTGMIDVRGYLVMARFNDASQPEPLKYAFALLRGAPPTAVPASGTTGSLILFFLLALAGSTYLLMRNRYRSSHVSR
jgi:hypothetical protein